MLLLFLLIIFIDVTLKGLIMWIIYSYLVELKSSCISESQVGPLDELINEENENRDENN